MPALYDVIRRHPDEVDKRWKTRPFQEIDRQDRHGRHEEIDQPDLTNG